MKIANAGVYRYRLPLARPLRLGAERVQVRRGMLLRLESDDGTVGWGEAAPLPSFSEESLDAAGRALGGTAESLLGRTVPGTWDGIVRISDEDLGDLPASVRFGMEGALWALAAGTRGMSLPAFIDPEHRPVVSLQALLSGAPGDVKRRAADLRARGYRAAKLKVGRRDVESEIALVRFLHRRWDGAVDLRLDANRAWSVSEAQAFTQGTGDVPIAYIEEPLAEPDELPAFTAATDCPVALDESMRDLPVDALEAHTYARAIVLKPTLVGGIVHTIRMSRRAAALGLTPVLSAAYESGVGLRALIALAAVIGTDDVPAGLDTYRRLRDDVLDPRLPIEGGEIDVNAVTAPVHAVDRQKLEHIHHAER